MDEHVYAYAKAQYEKWGIDVETVFEQLAKVKVSIHCWQGDDVLGFEENPHGLSGGIATTGNYPGRARNGEELRQDLEKALSLIPGKHKINLHAIYAETDGVVVPRNQLEPKHFEKWVKWAKEHELGLDFNPTIFSHPLAEDGLTLAHPDPAIRKFWIEHAIACRKIGEYFGKETGMPCVNNLWIPDGFKDMPSDRLTPRMRLLESLDEIYAVEVDRNYNIDTVESKVFGIGAESYTVGSNEFYMNYAMSRHLLPLMDTGHYHPTEVVSDKLSALLPFYDKIALHVSRPVRWDSDHVVMLDDELMELAKEIVRNDALDNVLIGLDFFDASINRIAAWTIGTHNMIKALLYALLLPHDTLKAMQDAQDYTSRLAVFEEFKTYPFGILWDAYCEKMGVPIQEHWMESVTNYEVEVLRKRGN